MPESITVIKLSLTACILAPISEQSARVVNHQSYAETQDSRGKRTNLEPKQPPSHFSERLRCQASSRQLPVNLSIRDTIASQLLSIPSNLRGLSEVGESIDHARYSENNREQSQYKRQSE